MIKQRHTSWFTFPPASRDGCYVAPVGGSARTGMQAYGPLSVGSSG